MSYKLHPTERIKVSDNFYADEFLHPKLYKKIVQAGLNPSVYINKRLLDVVQLYRELCGHPVIINNWATGGNFINSGVRYMLDNPYGALSRHLFGLAADLKVFEKGVQWPASKMIKVIEEHGTQLQVKGLTTIEHIGYTKTWLHLSVEWWPNKKPGELVIIKP